MIGPGHPEVITETEVALDVKDLLHQIVIHIESTSWSKNNSWSGGNSEEVLLRLRLNGRQYTLTRSPSKSPKTAIVNLSPREKEVARLVAKGLPNKAIASVLDISPWTVSTHLRRVFNKLGVGSRAEMVACVLKKGILGS